MTNKKIRIRFEEIKMIKDFKIALKDFEPYVKNPEYLWTKKFSNFDLLIREAWGNWLLCTVLRNLHGEHITFAEDKHGDGLIIDKRTREIIPTEHVSALEGLLTSDKNGYAYAITGFEDSLGDTSMTFKVQINKDFTDWWISQITQ